MSKLKKLYDLILCFKVKLLLKFASDRVKALTTVALLEELCKKKNSLSETSVAIVASGLGLKTSAKRKRTAKKPTTATTTKKATKKVAKKATKKVSKVAKKATKKKAK